MSTSLRPHSNLESGHGHGHGHQPTKRNRLIFIWIGLAVAASVVFLALAIAVGALLLGSTSSAGTTGEDPVVSKDTINEPADQATANEPTATTNDEAAELLLAFAETWRTADWDRMGTLASDDVVATAQEWHSEGGAPNISEDNLEFIFDTCNVDGAGATSCMIMYAPPEGFGLIFDIVYADTGLGLRLSQLTFGGDAG